MHHTGLRVLRTIAGDTLREARRGRWLWLTLLATAAVGAAALFARALALAEAGEVTLAFAAPLARLSAVAIVVLSTVASVVRERSERSLHLALAAPVSRTAWILGKAGGFAALAAGTGLLLAVPVIVAAPGLPAVAWTASLVLELVLVACVSLAIASVLGQVAPAAAACLAFYALARVMNVVMLLGSHASDYSDLGLFAPVVRSVGAVIPRLDLFTRTDWLLWAPPDASAAATVGVQALVYIGLALAAAVIDLRRASLG